MNNSSQRSFFSLPSYLRNSAYMLLGMTLFLCYDQFKWWESREDYSFGFIVPFFVGYVVFERWPKIRDFLLRGERDGKPVEFRSPGPLSEIALILAWAGVFAGLLVFGFFGFLAGVASIPLLPASQALAFSFACCVLGIAFIAASSPGAGKEGLRPSVGSRFRFVGLFVFPALIWMLSIPMLDFAETRVSLFLLNRVTAVVFFVFDTMGIPLERQGNVLILEKGAVGVEDACSGIRSLTACLFAGSFLAAVFLNRWWKKILLVASAMLLAFIMNIFRSLFLTAWANANGAESIDGMVHDVTGYAVLGLTCVGLLLLLPVFNLRFHYDDPEDVPETTDSEKGSGRE